MILAEAMKQLGTEHIKPVTIECDDKSSVWPTGYTLTNFMKNVFQLSVLMHEDSANIDTF